MPTTDIMQTTMPLPPYTPPAIKMSTPTKTAQPAKEPTQQAGPTTANQSAQNRDVEAQTAPTTKVDPGYVVATILLILLAIGVWAVVGFMLDT